MNIKQRILAIKLSDKIRKNPSFAKELGVEVVGETKVKIAIEEDEEPWDELEDELTDKDIEEIDKVDVDFIK